jgi:rhomboid family GlyGly-CTERM serine protease
MTLSNRHSASWEFVVASLIVMTGLQLLDIQIFRFQQDWIQQLEPWRLITAHWVHFNWQHLALNGLGLVLCVAIARPVWSKRRWGVYNLLLAFGISILFSSLNPELDWYVGYSGVLFGLFLLAAIELYKTERMIALLLGMGVCSKVGLEQISDATVTSGDLIGVPVIIDAHLYGLLLALVIAIGNQIYSIAKPSKLNNNVK